MAGFESDGGDEETDASAAPDALVRTYYRSLDDHDYEALESVLALEFTQRRPDRTFEGREAFVGFMREERPTTDTSHQLLDVLVSESSDRAVARGRLLDSAGDQLFDFADVFTLEEGRIVRLETYTR